ncbi:MAG: flagellar basal body P-ring formation protein FlgA, partial [Rhodocyclaceae bacterium]|nr:flagellar basal body P-ring formation protein FlgA [Rhodocyclaceae bacterium]
MPASRRRRTAHSIVSSSIAVALALLAVAAPPASARQDPAAVRKAVEDYMRVQTRGLPGTVTVSAGAVDPNNQLAPCAALEVAMAPGARAWGRSSAAVSCPGEGGWKIFVPVQVRVQGEYLVLVRTVPQGQALVEADLGRQTGDLTELP